MFRDVETNACECVTGHLSFGSLDQSVRQEGNVFPLLYLDHSRCKPLQSPDVLGRLVDDLKIDLGGLLRLSRKDQAVGAVLLVFELNEAGASVEFLGLPSQTQVR